ESLGPRALQDVVVLEVPAGGLEVAEVLLRGVAIAGAEEVVLELGRGKRRKPGLARAFRLPAQDRARRDWHVIVRLLALDVAHHEGRLIEPARHAQRR